MKNEWTEKSIEVATSLVNDSVDSVLDLQDRYVKEGETNIVPYLTVTKSQAVSALSFVMKTGNFMDVLRVIYTSFVYKGKIWK